MADRLWWAKWWGRLLTRFGLTLLSEAEELAAEKARWRIEISDALDMTVEDHGTKFATLDEAKVEIARLRRIVARDAEMRRTIIKRALHEDAHG